jgi:hypothetical protein
MDGAVDATLSTPVRDRAAAIASRAARRCAIARGLIRDVQRPQRRQGRASGAIWSGSTSARSLFCASRERQARAALRVLRRGDARDAQPVGLPAQAQIEECRAMAAGTCVITFRLSGARVEDDPALAA